jgi:leucyl-tRNA synthetase
MVNSGFLDGIKTKKEAIAKMLEYLEGKGIGEKGVQYKMKD